MTHRFVAIGFRPGDTCSVKTKQEGAIRQPVEACRTLEPHLDLYAHDIYALYLYSVIGCLISAGQDTNSICHHSTQKRVHFGPQTGDFCWRRCVLQSFHLVQLYNETVYKCGLLVRLNFFRYRVQFCAQVVCGMTFGLVIEMLCHPEFELLEIGSMIISVLVIAAWQTREDNES